MAIPDELKDSKIVKKVSISKRILLNEIVIMHGKVEFPKIKGNIWNALIEDANIYNTLQRSAVPSRLIVVKLKRAFKYMGYIYFEPVYPHTLYQALVYFKYHNRFYEDISTAKVWHCWSSRRKCKCSLQNSFRWVKL